MEKEYAMKVRFKFKKMGMIKFIPHLDLLRTFQRAFIRAKVPLLYTEGFNPHPKMAFALPLPLGVSSLGEYIDIETKDMDLNDAIKTINQLLPLGLEILHGQVVHSKESAANLVQTAQYIMSLCTSDSLEQVQQKLHEMLSSEEIWQEKRSKKKGKERVTQVNIRPLIHKVEIIEAADQIKFSLLVSAGNKENLRPEMAIAALQLSDYVITATHREGLYGVQDGKSVDLLALV